MHADWRRQKHGCKGTQRKSAYDPRPIPICAKCGERLPRALARAHWERLSSRDAGAEETIPAGLIGTIYLFHRPNPQPEAGRIEEAAELSDRLTRVVVQVFDLVGGIADGNAFANAGKAVDHPWPTGRKRATLGAPCSMPGAN